ncbi:MAG: integration host factor subunit beta [Candidatus Eisenbacteria sp.]|nr:integration host factor subunit beta [Candidatus Eisenbacteria bacterium]
MTKADLVERVAARTGLTKKDVAVITDHLLEGICEALVKGGHVEIRGLGSFKTKTRKARQARNPRTGESVFVPEKVVPYFKASKELRARVIQEQESAERTPPDSPPVL